MKKRTRKIIHKVIHKAMHYLAVAFTCTMFWVALIAFLLINNPSGVPALIFVVATGWCVFYALWCDAKQGRCK